MCKVTQELLSLLLFATLFACVLGVLRGEEPSQWYLISETELQSIERLWARSGQEKQAWLLQARALRLDSASLNGQLAQDRDQKRRLQESFDRYERDRLTLLSSKNGEIAALKQEKADMALRTEKAESKAAMRLFFNIALSAVIFLYGCYKLYRKFRFP